MPFIVLIPGILCIAAVFRSGTRNAFLAVLIPVLMFLPTAFVLQIQHLPALSFEDTALLSLGIGMLMTDVSRWRFSRMDCWVALFVVTASYSQMLPFGVNGLLLHLITIILEVWFPYMVGKLLVEQPGMRIGTIKRVVTLMAICSVLSMPQFFLRVNPHIRFWSHFFPGQWDLSLFQTQVRWGFGRVGGPYGGSESAGMVLLIGVPLALWLQHCKYQGLNVAGSLRPPLKHTKLIVSILIVMLYMTQARGPWIGTTIALIVASIGRAKRPLRRAVVICTLGVVVGIPLYQAFKDYASGPRTDFGSERETAQYRAQLIDNYVPIAKMGGPWGWGGQVPVVGGQASIDNEYLLVWLVQGYVGLTSLIVIFIDAFVSLIIIGMATRSSQELHFIYTLLGILIGMAVCLGTVWLNSQSVELFFLLLGWSQAIRPAAVRDQHAVSERLSYATPQTAAIRVYT